MGNIIGISAGELMDVVEDRRIQAYKRGVIHGLRSRRISGDEYLKPENAEPVKEIQQIENAGLIIVGNILGSCHRISDEVGDLTDMEVPAADLFRGIESSQLDKAIEIIQLTQNNLSELVKGMTEIRNNRHGR